MRAQLKPMPFWNKFIAPPVANRLAFSDLELTDFWKLLNVSFVLTIDTGLKSKRLGKSNDRLRRGRARASDMKQKANPAAALAAPDYTAPDADFPRPAFRNNNADPANSIPKNAFPPNPL